MRTFIFGGVSFSVFDNVPKECRMDSRYFCDIIIEETQRAVTSISGTTGIEGMMIHLDN
jgi:hypothetical protein